MLEVTKKNFKIRKSALIHGYLNLWFQKENYITLDWISIILVNYEIHENMNIMNNNDFTVL